MRRGVRVTPPTLHRAQTVGRVLLLNVTTGTISTVAGTGTPGGGCSGSGATACVLSAYSPPTGVPLVHLTSTFLSADGTLLGVADQVRSRRAPA